jgi:polar amino acid transport system substrate-binding protein
MRFAKIARFASAVAAAGALLALSGCSSGTASAGSSTSGVATAGTLAVGSDLTYPPYAYLNGGTPAGFDPDISRALAQQAGLKATFVDTRFEELIAGLESGRFDVIASDLYITDARKQQVDFIPYITTGNSLLVQSSGTYRPRTPADLCGKAVAVIAGGQIVNDLRGEASRNCTAAGRKPIDVREFASDPEGTQALLAGQVDAQLTDSAVAKAAVDKIGGTLVISSTELIYPIQAGLAVKKGNTALEKTLTNALHKLQQAGTYTKLLTQYNLRPAGVS